MNISETEQLSLLVSSFGHLNKETSRGIFSTKAEAKTFPESLAYFVPPVTSARTIRPDTRYYQKARGAYLKQANTSQEETCEYREKGIPSEKLSMTAHAEPALGPLSMGRDGFVGLGSTYDSNGQIVKGDASLGDVTGPLGGKVDIKA